MTPEIETKIKELKNLYRVWNMINADYDDGEDKQIAQKVIDALIISIAQDIAKMYETDD